jgi:uncharacterized membrane protein YfcA
MEVGLLMLVAGVAAGVFGSWLGIGGGTLIVPLLTLVFNLPVREAVGVSLVCVIVTSSASASVYLQRNVANLRLGMFLELFTATGAVIGGAIAFLLDERVVAGLFAAVLVYVAGSMLWRSLRASTEPPELGAPGTNGDGTGRATTFDEIEPPSRAFVDGLSGPGYVIRRLRIGAAGSVFAGVISALLGIGGGIVKVPVMNLLMGVPLRVATATSNLMIGITASTSAIVYLLRGSVDPYVAGPTAVGVFIGATVGSRIAHRIDVRFLRLLFVVVLLYTAFAMAQRAAGMAG